MMMMMKTPWEKYRAAETSESAKCAESHSAAHRGNKAGRSRYRRVSRKSRPAHRWSRATAASYLGACGKYRKHSDRRDEAQAAHGLIILPFWAAASSPLVKSLSVKPIQFVPPAPCFIRAILEGEPQLTPR